MGCLRNFPHVFVVRGVEVLIQIVGHEWHYLRCDLWELQDKNYGRGDYAWRYIRDAICLWLGLTC